ncbi:hypothetical protein COCCADRAFT_27276 [Bipolaris zeicola 26-R-13]|uniref:Uncharacterized protein n=1 Tax=Cochliobolus carbonum (strain 26-R-13) TaxID=930089 RepID=W6YL46_COCC2|nr:uncharacterized protein COCCADRAFT_27276 [Bipolaris zeicola 26-R-13]EUC32106.1 hypothetical protein COCCADRAFT_27276 [Bipolaris zeicola 26-R-13]
MAGQAPFHCHCTATIVAQAVPPSMITHTTSSRHLISDSPLSYYVTTLILVIELKLAVPSTRRGGHSIHSERRKYSQYKLDIPDIGTSMGVRYGLPIEFFQK